ncbi:MAG TPA: zinc-binding dehydrogenase [Actinomycetota bacterium]|nr:zinc-binding dehydrogenase [Actinomycetota bacterium]
MRVARLTAPGRFEVVDEPVAPLGRDDVLLRVTACGVCASELDMFTGLEGHATYPWYPGHEVAGVVERVGDDVAGLAPGTPVAAWVTTRGYADYVTVKAEYCYPARGSGVGLALAEPLACAVNAVELARIALGDDVAIVGAGFMGHLVHRLVELRGPRRVIVADARPDALKRAAAFGATRTVDVTRESMVEAVADATDGAGVDVCLEVTGVQAALDVVGDVTRMSGTVVIVGYHQGAPRSIPLGAWNWKAFRIVNAHFRELETILRGMRVALRLMESGRVSTAELVTHRFTLDHVDTAFQTALARPDGFVKAVVEP